MSASLDDTKDYSVATDREDDEKNGNNILDGGSGAAATSNNSIHSTKSVGHFGTDELRQVAEKISNDIATTINSLSASLLPQSNINSNTSICSSTKDDKNVGGIARNCWIVPSEATAPQSSTNNNDDDNADNNQESPPRRTKEGEIDSSPSSPMRSNEEEATTTANSNTDPSPPASPPSVRKHDRIIEAWNQRARQVEKEEEELSHQAPKSSQNDNDGGLFLPFFSAAAMSMPASRKEMMDIFSGKCGTPHQNNNNNNNNADDVSTESEWTASDYDSYSTPQSRSPRRRKSRKSGDGGTPNSRRSSGRKTRSRSKSRERSSSNNNSPWRKKSAKGGASSLQPSESPERNSDGGFLHTTPDRKPNKKLAQRTSRRQQSLSPPPSPSPPQTKQQQQQQQQQSFDSFGKAFPVGTTPASAGRSKSPRKSPRTSPMKAAVSGLTTPLSPSTVTTTATVTAADVDITDKSFIKVFIREMTTHGCRLRWWYKEQPQHTSASTMIVRMFLQPGHMQPATSGGNYCGPVLVWGADEYQNDQFFGVNLFDIRTLDRTTTTTTTTTNAYASASHRCGIFIKLTKGNEYFFQAASEPETIRFVHGMKWVIARLAFNLVIGNLDVSSELVEVVGSHNNSSANGATATTANDNYTIPRSILEEAQAAKAMDDVTFQMIDKSVSTRIR
eukprot:scaffold15311_cov136-Cylindrotheca_fusiformis.AAC.6